MNDQRRDEAERLIMLARGLLNQPQEELIVAHLDQAVEVLHMVTEGERAQSR